MKSQDKANEGICIVSFDGGGPGSMSQLRILDEVMIRMAFKPDNQVDEILPADYFDLMGGVGFGGLVAILLGRLRMTTKLAMEELAEIGADTFPKGEDLVTTEVAMARLRKAIESMLERHSHPADMKLLDSSDSRCKVVLFAATTTVIDHCYPFRTYRSPRKCLDCTLVDAVCATMATPEYFSSVVIGPRRRKQNFAGIPHGFDNPMREVLKEAQLIFGERKQVSLVLSLGSGQRARLSDLDRHVTRQSRVHCDGVARDLQHQLREFGEYLRLNVDHGMEKFELDDWHELGSIESHTDAYLEMVQITGYIDRAVQWLLQRNGSVTLGQISGSSADCVAKCVLLKLWKWLAFINNHVLRFHSETLTDYLTMEFKQMHNVVQQLGIEKITLVDAMGNNIPIPLEFCLTYDMLSDVISIYFRHQKAPGSDFVERGDYRLVNGNRRNTVGPMEWTRIEKVGLKVEMSMILRTRNEDKPKCPSCRTLFEGSATDGWAQCLSCTGHFQVETQVQPDTEDQSPNDTARSDDDPLVESIGVIPAIERLTKLQFRLISVINLMTRQVISSSLEKISSTSTHSPSHHPANYFAHGHVVYHQNPQKSGYDSSPQSLYLNSHGRGRPESNTSATSPKGHHKSGGILASILLGARSRSQSRERDALFSAGHAEQTASSYTPQGERGRPVYDLNRQKEMLRDVDAEITRRLEKDLRLQNLEEPYRPLSRDHARLVAPLQPIVSNHLTARPPKGWFNSRGDQLVGHNAVIRQPPDREYLPCFARYPAPGQGFADSAGNVIDMEGRLVKRVG